jgi:hypothetical protein
VVGGPWPTAIERLAQQLDHAQTANRRVSEAKRTENPARPKRDDYEPAEYQRRLREYVQTPEYKAAEREVRGAVALSKAHDAALLRTAHQLLARRAGGSRPPRRLPQPRILPGSYVPQWWIEAINTTYAGIWRAIPSPGPELRLGGPDDPLVQDVAKQARLLQASLVGYRERGRLYEAYHPNGPREVHEPGEPIGGQRLALSLRANPPFGRGGGIRIPLARLEEADQMHTDYFAVWDRSRTYGAAVLALLHAHA